MEIRHGAQDKENNRNIRLGEVVGFPGLSSVATIYPLLYATPPPTVKFTLQCRGERHLGLCIFRPRHKRGRGWSHMPEKRIAERENWRR